MLHVRFEGRSYQIPGSLFDSRASDVQIKEHVARHLDVGVDRLDPYVVDRTPTGHVVVRPEAVYG